MRFFLNTLMEFMQRMFIAFIFLAFLIGMGVGNYITISQLKQIENKKLSTLVQREIYLKAVINSNKKLNDYLAIKKHYANKIMRLNTKFAKALANKEFAEIKY